MFRIILLDLMLASPAAAHEPDIGPNGGARVDAAPYRVELVPDGSTVVVHITLDDDSAVDTTGMSGIAILLIDGKPVRVPLVPAAPGTLLADTGVAVPSDVKGGVQIIGADGVTVQAKY